MGSDNTSTSPSAGAIGGAADEAGSLLRAGVGASLAAAVIRGCAVSDAGLKITDLGPARAISAETDDPLDDLVVVTDEGRVLVQVKRRLSLAQRHGPTSAALDQLVSAGRSGLGAGGRLVIAYASGTNEVAALRGALDRRRRASLSGAPTSAEQAALQKLTDRLDERLDNVLQREAVLDALHLWKTDPTQGDGHAALAARLEGAVCATGAGQQAARELTELVRELARTRSGEDAIGLVAALAARDVPLSATANRVGPTAAVAALLRHRQRVVGAGTTLGLFGAVPPALADLPLADVDAGVQVDRPDDERRVGHDLVPTLRRRGRALLVGDAGGGKSTALRATAAEWGRRPSWPVPILVHLRRLSSPGEGPTAQLLQAACSDLPSAERIALTAGLERALSRGECLVLLDGLDEVRQHRQGLLERLGKWLRDLHSDCEVLIATRPVYAGDATAWDLPHLHLS